MTKTIITLLLAVSALATVSSRSIIESVTVDNKSIIVSFDGWKTDGINVSITDTEGNVLVSEKIARPTISKRYNLKRLPAGIYYLSTEDAQRIERQTIAVYNNSISANSDISIHYKPFLSITDGFANVNFLTGDDRADIYIYDQDGSTLYTDSFSESAITKRYDLSQLPTGSYTIIVANEYVRTAATYTK